MAKPTHSVVDYDTDEDVYEQFLVSSLEEAVALADSLKADAVLDGFEERDVTIYELKLVEV